jgi:branched-chain amino acid transport system permease protein
MPERPQQGRSDLASVSGSVVWLTALPQCGTLTLTSILEIQARRCPRRADCLPRRLALLQYVIAGLVLGSIYALAASGLVITYVSTSVLNFAFGAIAFFIARLFYFLHTQHHWTSTSAGLISVGVAAPLLGVFLWFVLFRFLRLVPHLIRIVATVGLAVCIAPVTQMLFGTEAINAVPGLAPEPVRTFRVFNSTITLDQLIVYAAVVVILAIGALTLRFTEVGLKVRALVDSEAMTSMSGANPRLIEICIWAASTFLAGLVGVLAAPVVGLTADNFTLLVAAAFAAVVAAKLRSVSTSIAVGFLMGIAGSVVQKYLPPSSTFAAAIVPSIPGIFILVFLIYQIAVRRAVPTEASIGGALDGAILPHGGTLTSMAQSVRGTKATRVAAVIFMLLVAALPLTLTGFWIGLVALGAAYGIAFLSFSLVTGEGGMIWLCEITFAGVGAITTGQLSTIYHWPVLAAVIVGGIVAGILGGVIAALTVRLGDLYVALVTLTLGLLADRLLFIVDRWYKFGSGVIVPRPGFAQSDRAFTYVALVAFSLVAVAIATLRRSTAGLALAALRSSPTAASVIGLSVTRLKVAVASAGALVAGVGGGFLSMYSQNAVPPNFATIMGLTWLAVLVTNGTRSNSAALLGGLAFSFIPALFLTYLSAGWQPLPTALFGLGAIFVARNPEGVITHNARLLEAWIARRTGPPRLRPGTGDDAGVAAAGAQVTPSSDRR